MLGQCIHRIDYECRSIDDCRPFVHSYCIVSIIEFDVYERLLLCTNYIGHRVGEANIKVNSIPYTVATLRTCFTG